jgi:hypothetical protein
MLDGHFPMVRVFLNYTGHLSALSCSTIRTSASSCLSSWPKRGTDGLKKRNKNERKNSKE